MKKTWLCGCTALLLVALSLGLALHRQSVLGDDLKGPLGASAWKITLAIHGKARAETASLAMSLPTAFRRQHIYDERFPRQTSLNRTKWGGPAESRELRWRRGIADGAGPADSGELDLLYTFRCVQGMHEPTPLMKKNTRELDRAPAAGECLKPTAQIECLNAHISQAAQALVEEGMAPLDQARSLFHHVHRLGKDPTLTSQGALACLQSGRGNAAGKSRLLVALCRNRNIPARLVAGLVLIGTQEQHIHYWAEAWLNDHWLPLDPTYGRFGPREAFGNYLVLHVGDQDWLRAKHVTWTSGVSVEQLRNTGSNEDEQPSALKEFWEKASLYSLGPAEQTMLRFLLLLPLATVIVCLFRVVVGLRTYGTFGTALLGLAFLDLRTLPWGIGIFVTVVLVGWGVRRLMEHYHLLLVPRTAFLLTSIILVLIVGTVVLSWQGVFITHYVSLFPLIILTHMVERFWTLEAEDGTAAAFKTLLATVVVTVTISLALTGHFLITMMFRFPELLGVALAAQMMLGRYTGYRLTELYRFRDLVVE
jgi:transglutaminase-like putative cysteine protease